MRRLIYGAAIAAMMSLGGPALAGKEPPPPPLVVDMQTCFYECKEGRTVRGLENWREMTTLMVANPTFAEDVGYTVVFLDGIERLQHVAGGRLSHGDIDEINVCRTLRDRNLVGGIGEPAEVPQAGLISVVYGVDLDAEGIPIPEENPGRLFKTILTQQFNATWVKNFLGRFQKDGVGTEEPFANRVEGIAKTACQPSIFLPTDATRYVDIDEDEGTGAQTCAEEDGNCDNFPLPVFVNETGDNTTGSPDEDTYPFFEVEINVVVEE